MRGGLKYKKQSAPTPISSVSFSIKLISSSIVDSVVAVAAASRVNGGANQFYKDISYYLSNKVDPVHDFKELGVHPLYNDTLAGNPRVIPYIDKDESEILALLLHDPNLPQGIASKYTRYYDLETDESMNIWREIDNGFNQLGGEHAKKFCVWNASIANAGARELDTSYTKIVPLPLRWDPVRSGAINFTVGKSQIDSDNFYNSVYSGVFDTLHRVTGIKVQLHENRSTDPVSINIIITLPQSAPVQFVLDDNGFSIDDILHALEIVANKGVRLDDLENETLKQILQYLGTRVSSDALISFLLTCKMSGDLGCVKFVKRLSLKGTPVYLNGVEQQTAVRNKPIVFLYTGDRLCASQAIVNDTKCVFKHNGYVCQYLSTKYKFDVNVFIIAYEEDLRSACQLVPECSYDLLTTIGVIPFVEALYNACFQTIVKVQSSQFKIATEEDFVRCVISISAFVSIKRDLKRDLNAIVKKYTDVFRQETFLISLELIQPMYEYKRVHGFFDPLVRYLHQAMFMPNEEFKKKVYDYIRKQIHDKLKIVLSDNFKVLEDRMPVTNESSTNEDEFVDDEMLDSAQQQAQKKPKKPVKPKAKSSKKKKNSSDSGSDPDYVPSEDS